METREIEAHDVSYHGLLVFGRRLAEKFCDEVLAIKIVEEGASAEPS